MKSPVPLLAIDTSGAACSLALCDTQGQVWTHHQAAERQQAKSLVPQIHALLEQAHMPLQALQGIAFGAGPGSFTGLRIACMCAQSLAWALHIPVYPISTLEAYAWQTYQSTYARYLAVALDARMGEVYWGLYQIQEHSLQTLVPAQVCPPDQVQWPQAYQDQDWVGVGSGWQNAQAFSPWIQGQMQQLYPDADLKAQAILALAEQAWARGEGMAAAQAQPFYIRDQVTHRS
ncbi:tRNA threonylcarbamoyladenosine biosynthesis protein TsaB [Allopseudospirillum japonicum]|uniref:tRNA threonylcarbamoyladenosine biosynthesis protein TsaB n=1 Tax=Allopseudospirillum japonicum TaxID=64971 RepID=A0A1H6RIW6_9GAMM|nr:tRNA (adenosine(37)-N6)-threonylcarbamoyltransferase complex dimerization subunit type 1 TsaB [Allopseudospirillum japonicum]SEI54426.1 tRNA threonylcarbamoyladenosine biosynthesis protein TsaB [Allopseudospirillum japonicum]